jgi:KaiC/GvpD/RAD55 family RecA-like ATPase
MYKPIPPNQSLIVQNKDAKINISNLKKSIEDNVKSSNNIAEKVIEHLNDLFEVMKASQAVLIGSKEPNPVYLIEDLIIENSLVLLFADTGVGKTVLAFQWAIATALTGRATIFFDLELSKKQFQKRLVDENGNLYNLPDNLFRVDYKSNPKLPDDLSYSEFIWKSLLQAINTAKAKVIIIDNMTKIVAGDTDSAKASLPILEKLNSLKHTYKLTIIVLEHNKKVDNERPIQINDLQGSKMKVNFADSVITIGKSIKDSKIRYIKQLKVRDGEMIYDENNVRVCEISKSKGYLAFDNIGVGSEYEHLKVATNKDKIEMALKVKELADQNKTQREISKELGISLGTVNKLINQK